MMITITAEAVAWYGAIVATASVAFTGYALWRDRTRASVVATANMRITGRGDELFTILEVSNIGRRPITLQVWPYFTLKGESRSGAGLVVPGPWEPGNKINEGESASMRCNQRDLDLSTISGVIVKDAVGRKWKGRLIVK